jgi:hypothetical protein
MKRGRFGPAVCLAWLVALTSTRGLTQGGEMAGRFYGAGAASALVTQGLMLPAPVGPPATAFQSVPAPSSHNVQNVAQATLAPWVDSNAWRFARGLRKVNYDQLPPGSAALAAAEAFAFDVSAILNVDSADVAEAERMLRFLKAREQPHLPVKANVEVVDDGSASMGELLNMLSRRNLLYRVVTRPQGKVDLTVQLGSREFPRESAANPSDFAARVREKLGDDRRLVRIYGTSTVIAHLTGDARRARLYLLSYSRNRNQGEIRVRVRGRYQPESLAAYGAPPDANLLDVRNPGNTTEFSIPAFNTIAIVDLTAR